MPTLCSQSASLCADKCNSFVIHLFASRDLTELVANWQPTGCIMVIFLHKSKVHVAVPFCSHCPAISISLFVEISEFLFHITEVVACNWNFCACRFAILTDLSQLITVLSQIDFIQVLT